MKPTSCLGMSCGNLLMEINVKIIFTLSEVNRIQNSAQLKPLPVIS